MNNGDPEASGGFNIERLPVEAQFSPIYSILTDEFNKDGYQDMLLGGNFYGVPLDQGRYDASYGRVLIGDGKDGSKSLSLQESGFVVTGQVCKITPLQNASGNKPLVVAGNNDTK